VYQFRIEVVGGAGSLTWDSLWLNATGRTACTVLFQVTDPESGFSQQVSIEVGPSAPQRPNYFVYRWFSGLGKSRFVADSVHYVLWQSVTVNSTSGQYDFTAIDPDTGVIFRRIPIYPTTNGLGSFIFSSDFLKLFFVSSNGIYVIDVNSGVVTRFSLLKNLSLAGVLPGPEYLPITYNSGNIYALINSAGTALPNRIATSSLAISQEGDLAFSIDQVNPNIQHVYTIDRNSGFISLFSKTMPAIGFSIGDYAYSSGFPSSHSSFIYNRTTLDEVGVLDSGPFFSYGLGISALDGFVYRVEWSPTDSAVNNIIKYSGAPLQRLSVVTSPVLNLFSPTIMALGQNRVVLREDINPASSGLQFVVCNGS
jgi:hypothetical protein